MWGRLVLKQRPDLTARWGKINARCVSSPAHSLEFSIHTQTHAPDKWSLLIQTLSPRCLPMNKGKRTDSPSSRPPGLSSRPCRVFIRMSFSANITDTFQHWYCCWQPETNDTLSKANFSLSNTPCWCYGDNLTTVWMVVVHCLSPWP